MYLKSKTTYYLISILLNNITIIGGFESLSKFKLMLLTNIIIYIVIFNSCKCAYDVQSDIPNVSDSAVQYEFPSENILKYRKIIVDSDYIMYFFDAKSDIIKTIQTYDDLMLWTEYYNSSQRNLCNNWKLVQDQEVWILIIFCNTKDYDLEAGIALSNCLEDDGISLKYDYSDMTILTIRYIEEPLLRIEKISVERISQDYKNGSWSDIRKTSYTNWNP